MGIVPDIEYGVNCLPCFPPLLTPKYVFISAAGIGPGQGWFPPHGGAANGLWMAEQDAPCSWSFINGMYRGNYTANAGAAGCSIIGPLMAIHFDAGPEPPCTKSFSNILGDIPPNPFFGGSVEIFFNG